MIVTTKSGSVYHIGLASKTWTRISTTDKSGNLRTGSGHYEMIGPLEIGLPIRMLCPPLNPETVGRWIITSPVIKLEENSAACSMF